MPLSRFAKFSWFAVVYNVAVIVWGAFVRASDSGAGCGRHWPLCNGEVIPHAPIFKTMVELGHRLTAGLSVAFVAVLAIGAFRVWPKGHPGRKSALWSCGFVFAEALIGAGLVRFELVSHDASMTRALSMALHLTNTFFLLGVLVLTAWWASGGAMVRLRRQGAMAWLLAPAFVGMLLLGMSGAVAALGDLLFPAHSWSEGVAQDLATGAHLFIRLRILHPFFATMTGVCILAAAAAARILRPNPRVSLASKIVTVAFLAQFIAGLVNVALLAPIAMQLTHLVLADAVWISLVILAATALEERGLEDKEHASSKRDAQAHAIEARS